MGGLLVQFLGLFALLGLVAWGYRHWISPRHVGIQGKGMLLLTVVTLVGGLLGSTGWWIDDPRSFSWDLPPLDSRMLASAGWAFGVVTLAALHRPVPRRTRLVMLMLAVYLTPLLVTAPLFHLDRFDPAAPITYVFFALVLAMTVAALWYLFEQPVIVPDEPSDSLAPKALISGWLGLVAAVTASWGLALFVTDNGPSGLIWVWPGDLLTSRLIAVMLLTIALGAVRPVLADYPARLAQAPDRDQVPAVRKKARPRRESGNQGRRSSVACNELDGASRLPGLGGGSIIGVRCTV